MFCCLRRKMALLFDIFDGNVTRIVCCDVPDKWALPHFISFICEDIAYSTFHSPYLRITHLSFCRHMLWKSPRDICNRQLSVGWYKPKSAQEIVKKKLKRNNLMRGARQDKTFQAKSLVHHASLLADSLLALYLVHRSRCCAKHNQSF